ncbi:MAG: DUF115 domain-containing protein, partial [Spirochaetaceae bacterium]|nr:DUF115 domain-containing protein [Spirochaetaceae bacterium]
MALEGSAGMNSVYEKNVRLLRSMYGNLPDLLPKTLSAALELRSTPEGCPTLSLGGKLIHSGFAPKKEAARLADAAFKGEGGSAGSGVGGRGGAGGRFIILLGFGLGYAALELEARLNSGGKANSRSPENLILIVEKRIEVLRAALEIRDWTEFFTNNRVMMLTAVGSSAIWGALDAAGTLFAREDRSPLIIRNRALIELDADYYRETEDNIALWRNKNAVNIATLARFGKRWERNLRANIPALQKLPGVRELFGKRSGLPALLLAAGPSLDAIAPHLAELRSRFVVVAVDTALRFLARVDVEPDFVVSGDAQYWNARHLDYARHFTGAAFIFDHAVYPSALRPFLYAGGGGGGGSSGTAYICSSNAPGAAELEKTALGHAAHAPHAAASEGKGKLASGGSVATSAWDFCRLLGASEIWIAGLDLSFPALRTHYKGAFFEERALAASNRLRPASTASFAALHSLPLFRAP